MDDQVPPDLQFLSQLSPSSPRVGPGSVRTSSSSYSYSPSSSSSYSTTSSSCSSSFAAAAAAPAAAGPFDSGKAPESQSASRQTAHNHGLV